MSRADNLTTFMCWLSWNLGDSNSWNPLGLSKPVMGIALPLPLLYCRLLSVEVDGLARITPSLFRALVLITSPGPFLRFISTENDVVNGWPNICSLQLTRVCRRSYRTKHVYKPLPLTSRNASWKPYQYSLHTCCYCPSEGQNCIVWYKFGVVFAVA